jgi:DNA-binding LacI/PurR family transcriptional regulator
MSSRKRPGAATSLDVARAAGVSQSVVSRTFSLAPGVSEATRLRVREAAERLGYRRNPLAHALITRQSNLLALVAGGLDNPLHLDLIRAFSRIAQGRGLRVLLVSAPEGQDIDTAIADVLSYMPAGIIAMAGTPSARQVATCHHIGVPVVLVGRDAGDTAASFVSCDNAAEAARVARALLQAGHRRFAFVSSLHAETSFNLDRERGFCTTVVEAGCAAPVVTNGGSSYAGGRAAAARLFGAAATPEAVFCAGDAIALGLMDAARRDHALRIPEAVSVIGFDDTPMAAWASYELTTVRQPIVEMATAAVEIVLGEAGELAIRAGGRFMPGELVRRRSARL